MFYLQYILEYFSMATYDSSYIPKPCAFHPKEMIYNFCKNQECLLPLCPSCIKVHTEQHRHQSTYGQFENIHKVVSDVASLLENNLKELDVYQEEIKENIQRKKNDDVEVRRKIKESKAKIYDLLQRFFDDFEKEINKSLLAFNSSMKENYHNLDVQINTMKTDIKSKIANLSNEKVLKTVISYHSKQEEKKNLANLSNMRENLDAYNRKRAFLVYENSSIQSFINELSKFMSLAFENWECDIKYVTDFVKTGFTYSSSQSSKFSRESKRQKDLNFNSTL